MACDFVDLKRRDDLPEVFRWLQAQAGLAKVEVRGCAKVEAVFTYAVAAYDLSASPKLLAECPA